MAGHVEREHKPPAEDSVTQRSPGGLRLGAVNFTATGTKHFHVMRILFDGDRMSRREGRDYLAQSAMLLRGGTDTAKLHSIGKMRINTDIAMVLLLSHEGVCFIPPRSTQACHL